MAKAVDLTYYAGDSVPLRIAVLDDAGDPVNIQTATEIRWAVATDAQTTPALIGPKTKMGGAITLVAGGGNEHLFDVAMVAGDTDSLAADPTDYYHEADIVLGGVDETSLTGIFTLKPTILK